MCFHILQHMVLFASGERRSYLRILPPNSAFLLVSPSGRLVDNCQIATVTGGLCWSFTETVLWNTDHAVSGPCTSMSLAVLFRWIPAWSWPGPLYFPGGLFCGYLLCSFRLAPHPSSTPFLDDASEESRWKITTGFVFSDPASSGFGVILLPHSHFSLPLTFGPLP